MFSLQRSDRSPSNVPMTSVSTLTTSLATSTGSVTTVSLNLRLAATVLPSTLLTPNTWLRTATTSTTLSAARGHSLVRNSNCFSTIGTQFQTIRHSSGIISGTTKYFIIIESVPLKCFRFRSKKWRLKIQYLPTWTKNIIRFYQTRFSSSSVCLKTRLIKIERNSS